ncbi:uncharacterized protein G2W53_022344 [Senna tora]|uniref:Uncharacterized protein n=1 Tax=Senna tora TaxID=362788 RepID=A0A834TPI9_9FABA|nr:uncharacterized protein G2W53_022344 [Senna tora]
MERIQQESTKRVKNGDLLARSLEGDL